MVTSPRSGLAEPKVPTRRVRGTVEERSGERLFDGVEDPGFEPVEVTHSPYTTHVRYRVVREGKS